GLELAPCGWQRDPRPPACGGGAKRGLSGPERPTAEALGRSQGGFRTKIHLRVEGTGKPMVILITAGQRHEQTVFAPLMKRPTRPAPPGDRARQTGTPAGLAGRTQPPRPAACSRPRTPPVAETG